MVDKIVIKQIVDDVILKCGISMKKIREGISSTIEGITDNDYEKNLLLEEITRFYYENDKKDYESASEIFFNGEKYSNEGRETNVSLSPEVIKEGKENGLLFAIHNHPHIGYCIPSLQDFINFSELDVKYGVVVGKGGVFIVKTPVPNNLDGEEFYPTIRQDLEEYVRQGTRDLFHEEFQKVDEDFHNNRIDVDTANQRANKLYNKWMGTDNHLKDCADFLNREGEENGFDTRVHYIEF